MKKLIHVKISRRKSGEKNVIQQLIVYDYFIKQYVLYIWGKFLQKKMHSFC